MYIYGHATSGRLLFGNSPPAVKQAVSQNLSSTYSVGAAWQPICLYEAEFNTDIGKRTSAMLRIGVHDEIGSTGFTIEGKLTRGGVAELEKCWHTVITADSSKPIIV